MEWLQKAGDLLDKLDQTAAERLNAGWTTLVTQLSDSSIDAPWRNIWWSALRSVYGELADVRL